MVIDEADLVLDKQFAQIKQIVEDYLPKHFQCIMMSATLQPANLDKLRKHLLEDPELIDCGSETTKISQYYVSYVTNVNHISCIFLALRIVIWKRLCYYITLCNTSAKVAKF